jgi:ATP-dependent helicase HrpA
LERQEDADAAHANWRDENSDFLSYLKLWEWYHATAKEVSASRLRKVCKENFVSFVRMREWHDTHHQIKEIVHEMHVNARGGQGERLPQCQGRPPRNGRARRDAVAQPSPEAKPKGRPESPAAP